MLRRFTEHENIYLRRSHLHPVEFNEDVHKVCDVFLPSDHLLLLSTCVHRLSTGLTTPLHLEWKQSAEKMSASPRADPDERIRRDLTWLRSYGIDIEETVEVDDAISVERDPESGRAVS